MDESTERPGLFARGGVGRFLLGLTVATIAFFVVTCCCSNGLGMVLGLAYYAGHNDEFEVAKTEGTAFASGHTITECVTETKARGAARCTWISLACATAVGDFARACIADATDDGYCASVVGPSGNIMQDIDANAKWRADACANVPGLWCGEVMNDVLAACSQRQRNDAPPEDDASAE